MGVGQAKPLLSLPTEPLLAGGWPESYVLDRALSPNPTFTWVFSSQILRKDSMVGCYICHYEEEAVFPPFDLNYSVIALTNRIWWKWHYPTLGISSKRAGSFCLSLLETTHHIRSMNTLHPGRSLSLKKRPGVRAAVRRESSDIRWGNHQVGISSSLSHPSWCMWIRAKQLSWVISKFLTHKIVSKIK